MPRPTDSGHLNLTEVFRRVQLELQAQLALSRLIEHPSTAGTACENHWRDILDDYLPKRYIAAPAFVINAAGQRSRQIDIAIFDHLHSTPLFPNNAAVHISIECVRAVFEVKQTITRQWLRDAGEKAASVRALHSNPQQSNIIAGLLAATSIWNPTTFQHNLTRALSSLPPTHQINLGCALNHGSFDHTPNSCGMGHEAHCSVTREAHSGVARQAHCGVGHQACESPSPANGAVNPTSSTSQPKKNAAAKPTSRLLISQPDESLMFLILRLMNHLNTQPPTPPADLLQYLNPPHNQ
ncbi:MAG: DUF6602 domain-containing protein [Acidobacteriota bacterium]